MKKTVFLPAVLLSGLPILICQFVSAAEKPVTLPKVPRADYVLIDDEVTWLPATIKFN